MSTSASGSGGVTSINDVVASFNGLTGAVTLSAGTGITLTGNVIVGGCSNIGKWC